MTNYEKYRGKCKEFSEALVKENPSYRLVRGFYHEPTWGTKEQHWWCVDVEGKIIDPTAKQFPSGGITECYEEFNGICECEECGAEVKEEDAIFMGRYPVCSDKCARALVGI